MAKVEADRGQVYYRWDSWRFRVKARNGEVLASGEAYKTKRDAVAACKALLPDGARIEVSPKA
jgi:uncharacterized protein YegP (UPF0339 family)